MAIKQTYKDGAYFLNDDGSVRIDDYGRKWRWSTKRGNWITEADFAAIADVNDVEKDEAVTEPKKRGRGRPRKEVTVARTVEETTKDALMDLFVTGAREKVLEAITATANTAVEDVVAYVDALREEFILHESKRLTISGPLGNKELTGTRHMRFEQLLKTVSLGLAAMLVGPAGSGKTFASEQVAEALDLSFYAISVGSQTSKSDIIGYMNANGDYIRTQFRDAYEHGGVFLMDEIDAGNANVLVLLNSALAGSQAAFPDKMVTKHENFRFVATANTYGTGANRQYVGRNQIDAATLDRFVSITWPVDTALELSTVSHLSHGSKWHRVVTTVRDLVESNAWRIVVSPRATIKGSHLLEAGLTIDEVIEMTLLGQADQSQQSLIRESAKRVWGN